MSYQRLCGGGKWLNEWGEKEERKDGKTILLLLNVVYLSYWQGPAKCIIEWTSQSSNEWTNGLVVDLLPLQLFSLTLREVTIQSGSAIQTEILKSTLIVSAVYPFVSGVWCYLGQQMESWVMNSGSKQLIAEMRPDCWYIISNQVHYVFRLIWLWSPGRKNLFIPWTYICLRPLLFALLNLQCVLFFNVLDLSSNYSRFCSHSS